MKIELLIIPSLLFQFSGLAQIEIDHRIQLTGSGSNARVSGIVEVNEAGDAVNADAIQKSSLTFAESSNTGNTYSVTLSPAPTYTTGLAVHFKASAANDGPSFLDVNGLGPVSIRKNFNEDLAAQDIRNGQIVSVMYDGTNFQMLSQTGNASVDTPESKRAFATSSSNHTGNLGGIAGADNICQNLANAASLGGNWKAFLSTSTTAAVNRSSFSGNIVNMKGQIISSTGWNGMRFYVGARIMWDENGNALPLMNTFVHTGTSPFGESSFTCLNWTSASASEQTILGMPNTGDYSWLSYTETNCSNGRRLYCIED